MSDLLPPDRPWLQRKVLRLYLRFWYQIGRAIDLAATLATHWIFYHKMKVEGRFGPVTTRAEREASWAEQERRLEALSAWRKDVQL